MKLSILAILALVGLLLPAASSETETAFHSTVAQQAIRYNFEYKCGGEIVVISHCRRDSDERGMPATRPEEDYCQVYYPDRPKRNGFTAMGIALRGDLIKMLQACGALESSQPASARPTAPSGTAAETAIDVWRRTISKTDAFVGKDDFAIIFTSPNNAAIYCRGMLTTDPKPYTVGTRDGRIVITVSHATPWSLALQPDGTLVSLSVHTFRWESGKQCSVDVLRPTARTLGKNATSPASGAAKTEPTGTAGYYFNEGTKYYNSKAYLKAVDSLKRAISLKPDVTTLANSYAWLAASYRELKQYDNAIAAAKESLRVRPDYADTTFGLGWSYYLAGQHQNALITLKEAVRLKPDDAAESYYWIGEVNLFGLKRPEDAIAAYRESLRLRPNDARTMNQIGLAFSDLEHFTEAVGAFKEAVRLKPGAALYQSNLGISYVEMGKKEDALIVHKTLQRLDQAKAKNLLERISSTFPDDLDNPESESLLLYGSIVASTGSQGSALPIFRRVLLLNPSPSNAAAAHRLIGEVYKGQKKYEKAMAAYQQAASVYQKAIRQKPDDAYLHHGLGLTYLAMGQKNQARAIYKRLSTLDKKLAQELYAEINKVK